MGFTVDERHVSRSFERSVSSRVVELRHVLKWDGTGDANDRLNEQKAYSAFTAVLPGTWVDADLRTLYLDTVRVDEEDAGGGIWNGSARYVPNTIQLAIGQERRGFNSSGGTQHILISRETTGQFATSGSAPNFGQLIGVSSDSAPTGADIYVPIHEFEVTRAFSDGTVTQAYENTIAKLTYTTNSSIFRGFAKKTVLFMGATGSQRGDGIWEITFKFAAQQDRQNVDINTDDGTISISAVGGWELLWVYYIRKVIGSGDSAVLADVPKYAYTERVYDSSAFSLLGINT
jgi:hypothetical protein